MQWNGIASGKTGSGFVGLGFLGYEVEVMLGARRVTSAMPKMHINKQRENAQKVRVVRVEAGRGFIASSFHETVGLGFRV